MLITNGAIGVEIESIRGSVLTGLKARVLYVHDLYDPYLAISIPMELATAKNVIKHLQG